MPEVTTGGEMLWQELTAEENESRRVPRNAVLFQEAGQRTFVASWFVVCQSGTVQNRFTFQRGTEHPNVRGQPLCPERRERIFVSQH
jgi:hypothetical protein